MFEFPGGTFVHVPLIMSFKRKYVSATNLKQFLANIRRPWVVDAPSQLTLCGGLTPQ